MRLLAAALASLVAVTAAAQDASYLVRSPQAPVSTSRNGYQQTVTRRPDGAFLVHVATDLGPIGARGGYRGVPASNPVVPEGFHLPRELRPALRPGLSAWEAATEVLRYAARRLRAVPDDPHPQDAVSVLQRGSGRCSGIANATVALLLAAGFEARTVSGVLVGLTGPIPHRWLECRLPGAGWVPTDPTLGLWVVTPRHVTFAAPLESVPHVEVLEVPADGLAALPERDGLPIRPDRGAELVCRVVGAQNGAMVELEGPGGDVRRLWVAPTARVRGLAPGRWRLALLRGGRVVDHAVVELSNGGSHSLVLRMPAAGAGDP